MNEDVKPENMRIHSRADELIACPEGEIAKRDARIAGLEQQVIGMRLDVITQVDAHAVTRAELAACRVAVENCEVFRARIAELESQYQRDVCGLNNEGDPIGGDPAGGYANDNARLRAELAAIKAQEPVEYQQLSRYENWDRVNKAVFELGLLSSAPERFRALYAAPVSEAKAQGVVMPEPELASEINRLIGLWDAQVGWSGQCMEELLDHAAKAATFIARLNASLVQQASVPDERANFESEYLKANYPRVHSGELSAPPIFGQTGKGEYEDDDMQKCWVMWQSRAMLAAPAAPAAAADAGLVDMYRHLQTVTPYRFKKIQDASVTDGGDVLYFHKDRFDAALLDDMAANCAKESK